MANLDGLSEEERKRVQALSDKTKGEFNRAQAGGRPRAKDAPASEQRRADATVNHVLTPDSQTRTQKTPQGHQREQAARDVADKWNTRSDQSADKAQQRADVRKEFNRVRNRDRVRERDDFER